MPLQKQVKSLPLASGLDEKAADKHLQPPKLATCDNGKFSKTGQVQKRNGFTRLPNSKISGTIATATQCASYQDERLLFDDNNAWSRADSGTWVDRGRITGCTFEDGYVHNNDSVTTTPLQIARANGYRVEAWAETDPDTVGGSTIPWNVYARVVDENTSLEVVPRTKVTTTTISVTKAMAQYDDSNYFNPQVQCVAIAGYIYILFCDCDATTSLVNITGAASGGPGYTTITCASHPGFLHNDVVTIAGTTSYNGSGLCLEPAAATNTFSIATAYVASETGTVSIKSNYAGVNRMGVHASVVNTNEGVHAELTPTVPAMDSTSIVFHVNATFPLFIIDHVANDTLADGAVVFRLNPGPTTYAGDTISRYRADYFMESSGAIIEYLEGGQPGYRGRNTIITKIPYFQATDAAHDGTSRTLSHIVCKANIGNEDNEIGVAFAEENAGTGRPWVMTQIYDEDLSPVGSPLAVLEDYVLISGSFCIDPDNTALAHFVFTMQTYASSGTLSFPDPGQANDHFILKSQINTDTGALATAASTVRRFSTLTSDLFVVQTKVYFMATYAITPSSRLYGSGNVTFSNFLSSINVVSDLDGNLVATGGTGLGGDCASTDWAPIFEDGRALSWFVSRVEAVAANQYAWGSSKYAGVSIGVGVVMQNRSVFNPSLAEIDFAPTRYLPSAEAGGSLLLAGGVVWEYGGDWMKENGFLTYPQISSVTQASSGGSLSDGSYNFIACYEWTNRNGDVQRSYPSDQITVVNTGGGSNHVQKVTLTVYTPQWTQKRAENNLSDPRIVIFRTVEGPGSVYFRVTDVEADLSSSKQDIDASTLKDIMIEDNEQLYSTGQPGDIFGNICPPCTTDIVLHKERIFVASIDGSVWFSKKLTPGVAVEFAEQQVKPIDNYSGKIACLGAVRDYVIVISEDNAYFLAGDGPSPSGAGTDFTPATIFTRDAGATIGCARTNSPIGFLYRAKGGIYQVSPGMQMKWIGSPVEDTVDTYEPTRMVVDDSEGEVYFGLDNATYGILVYNYVFDAWSTWKPRYAAFSSDITAKGMMVHNGTLNFAIPSGYLLEQNTGFTDIGSGTYDFSLLITTPWLRSEMFLHMARFYNILLSGTYRSDHTLDCTIYSNYDESITDAQSLVITSANSSPYILRQHVANQKARAIKITISDNPTSGTYESYQLDGISVEFGVRPGTFKLGTTKTLT